ncbi:dienelactone hydrolase family protein [Micromonospora olivasterospora]|uniref:Dienelactone hydrolase n=1 Tax=Micromonospora olivasterospora TaxID=1880 RepID=A0A562I2S4_MICOL|nr:dienelactone hydrolase family protein [Micromonospora olivasterospora]TWH65300.1 dienelactone hydrolase [Micromonospora olivasterospora]
MSGTIRIEPTVVSVPVVDGDLTVAAVSLGGVPRGAALLLTDSRGIDTDAVDLMNSLAEHGYESLCVDLAAPRGDRTSPPSDEELVRDVEALIACHGQRGWEPEQIGVVGYELGGRAAMLAAERHTLGAVVSVSPSGIEEPLAETAPALADQMPVLRSPWLGMFGGEDSHISPRTLSILGTQVYERSPAYTEVVRYPALSGAFYREHVDYRGRAASFDSWQRVIEWLNLRVVPRPTPLAEAWERRQSG